MIKSEILEVQEFVDLAPAIRPLMGLPDDQPIPAARIAIEEVEVEVETINNRGHRLLTPAALPRLTLFYLFALEVTDEGRYRVVLGNHLLVVGFDLDGCPGAEDGRYFLEDPGIFAELRRGDHGHVLLEILYVLAFLLGSPVGNLVLLLAGEVHCLPLHLHCPIYLILYAKCSRALKEDISLP